MALILDGTDGITSSGGTNVLQDDAVITENIADGAVSDAKIADGAVSDAKIAAMAAAKLTGDVAAARITTALNAPGSAPIFAARAWVNFNGSTVTIKGSGNVSLVTRSGTGLFVVNLTTAMPDTNYAFTGGSKGISGNNDSVISENRDVARTTSSISLTIRAVSSAAHNPVENNVVFFR